MNDMITTKNGRISTQLLLGCLALLAVTLILMEPSFAQSPGGGTGSSVVWTNAQNKATDFFYQFRTVVLIICAIAIIATLLTAISGRFPIQKALVISVAIVGIALASSIVTYFASATQTPAASAVVPYETDTGG